MILSASTLLGWLAAVCGEQAAQRLLATVHVSSRLLENESAVVSRAELAQARNLLLFDGLLGGAGCGGQLGLGGAARRATSGAPGQAEKSTRRRAGFLVGRFGIETL